MANGLLEVERMSPASLVQSVLNPAGPQASAIHGLWMLMLWVTTIIYVSVLAALFVAVRRQRHHAAAPDSHAVHRSLSRSVGAAVGVSALILLALLFASVWTGRSVASLHASSAVTIAVTGHQWWWEVEYQDATPARYVRTANEIHVPIGQPVVLQVTSRDVIHSFWAPNLQGKRDLIPGYTTAIWLQADRAGQFRGQCAEFCGLQHAHMAFTLVAETLAEFERWLDAQRTPAQEPQGDAARRGRDLFMNGRCLGCHTVQGTPAQAHVGPPLTHVATRPTIGAGTLTTTHEHLREWIRNPQAFKPGNQMPANQYSSGDLEDLVAYIETLR